MPLQCIQSIKNAQGKKQEKTFALSHTWLKSLLKWLDKVDKADKADKVDKVEKVDKAHLYSEIRIAMAILYPGRELFGPIEESILSEKLLDTPQIPNSLRDKFSHWDSQNETRIIHYEKKNRNRAKCFLFWENYVSLRIYLT